MQAHASLDNAFSSEEVHDLLDACGDSQVRRARRSHARNEDRGLVMPLRYEGGQLCSRRPAVRRGREDVTANVRQLRNSPVTKGPAPRDRVRGKFIWRRRILPR